MKTITLVTPCYQEEANVRICYEKVRDLFAEHLPSYRREHIFADNASTDRTAEILREIAAEDDQVKVIVNSRNFGAFRSLFNGLRYATGDAILCLLPADLQDPVELLPEFVRHWENGIEVVAGERIERQEFFALRLARRIFYRVVNAVSDFEIPEGVGEFQLIDRKVWQAVMAHDNHYPFLRGIIASCGFRRLIVPYRWQVRERGISSNNLPRLVDQALNGIFSFTSVPMRLCSLLGLVVASLCFLYAAVSLVIYPLITNAAPRGTPTIIVSLFFLSGVQMVFVGILGEYVTAIHEQLRRGPMVVERERINIPDVGTSPSKAGNSPAETLDNGSTRLPS